MMMKQGGCDSGRAKSKLFCKLPEEHNALRKKIEEIQKESATADNSKKGHSLNEKLAAVLKGRAEELE
ncbi:CCP, partial [Trifolium medium]|nr:CCP [Trifolium medium]